MRDTRFNRVFKALNITDISICETFNEAYLYHAPRHGLLVPGAIDVLNDLQKSYQLHIITNGFKDVQFIKLEFAGIRDFFDCIVLSEDVGFSKPHKSVFDFALNAVNGSIANSIYVGDHPLTDIQGSIDAGWDQVFYNPHRIRHSLNPTFEVYELGEIPRILNPVN